MLKEGRPGRKLAAGADSLRALPRDDAPPPKVESPGREIPQRSSPESPRLAPLFGWLPFVLTLLLVVALAVALWWTA